MLAALAHFPASAQSAADPLVEGTTIDGKAFRLGSLKGSVVLLMFWSTECAVCRDKMQELRLNYEGWKDKPFQMVLVSTDRRLQDLQDYERLIARLVPADQRFVQLWAGAPGYRDNFGRPVQLPTSYVLDKSGKVVLKYVGRIPSQEWNKIAELVYS